MWLITTELGLTPGRGPSGEVMLHVSPERAGEMVLVAVSVFAHSSEIPHQCGISFQKSAWY